MRLVVLLAAALAATPACADLYRWTDPQSGSIKYSNVPPPWLGDPEKERRAPAVKVIPSRQPGSKPAAAAPAALAAPTEPSPVAATLEGRWRKMLDELESLSDLGPTGMARAGTGIRQQIQAYEAVRAELERQDPAGAARRREEEGEILSELRKGIAAAQAPKPPALKK
jgi:hypothetical protein